jgi:hypothetical protein
LRKALFTTQIYRNPKETDKDFPYDPFWDDGDDWNHKGINEEEEGRNFGLQDYPKIVDRVPDDDEKIIATTQMWVDKMMSNMGICPYSSGQ